MAECPRAAGIHNMVLCTHLSEVVLFDTVELKGTVVPAGLELQSLAKPTITTPVSSKTTIAIQATDTDDILSGFPSHWYVDHESEDGFEM